MRVIKSTNAGFFANLCDALRHIYLAEEAGEEWYVNWGPESNYFDAAIGNNAFNYFFQQFTPTTDIWHPDNNFVSGYVDIPITGYIFRNIFSNLINKHLQFAPLVKTNYQKVMSIHKHADFANLVGVHFRGTDKYNGAAFGEPASAQPLPLQMYLHLTRRCLERGHYDGVFLATDCANAADAFSKEFGDKLLMIEGPRSHTQEPIHTGHKHISGFLKGMSVFMDALILANCGYLIRGTSNVSSFAQFMNLKLDHLNVNELFMGDDREVQYGLTSVGYRNFL